MVNGGGWKPSTFVVTCLLVVSLYYLWSQGKVSSSSQARRAGSAYERPGTLTTHANGRLDGNLTGDPIPLWSPFDRTGLAADHGRLLEKLFLSIGTAPDRIIDPLPTTRIETILFLGDSNERGIVEEVCIKAGVWPTVYSSKTPPAESELWHADPHVCELEIKRERRRLRLVSFMNYGVLIERGSKLWDKKVELDGGPWSIEERIDLAQQFVENMGWEKVDLLVFNSNLWDLMYLHDTHLRLKTAYEFSLPLTTLNSYISRSVFALSRLQESFPSTRITLRTLHPLHPGRPIDFFNSRRVAQINQAAIEIVSQANNGPVPRRDPVRLLDVGKVMEGWPTSAGEAHTILKDKVHLAWSPGLWIYGEMVLDALSGL